MKQMKIDLGAWSRNNLNLEYINNKCNVPFTVNDTPLEWSGHGKRLRALSSLTLITIKCGVGKENAEREREWKTDKVNLISFAFKIKLWVRLVEWVDYKLIEQETQLRTWLAEHIWLGIIWTLHHFIHTLNYRDK